ncbi:MAG: hypothetical protein E4H01_03925 [Lysobacterales bacterium]|nr:MAG: hypothetical protein E4H01_03925 [Xanthomonadales bacterium]
MSDMEEVRKMFSTLIGEQSVIRGDIKDVKERLTDLIRLEQAQMNQDRAIERMGHVIDKQDEKIEKLELTLVDVRVESVRTMTKVSLIGGGGGAGAAAVVAGLLKLLGVI